MNTTHDQLDAHLQSLKLAFIREHYPEVLHQAAQKKWTPEDILLHLVEGEAHQRADRALWGVMIFDGKGRDIYHDT